MGPPTLVDGDVRSHASDATRQARFNGAADSRRRRLASFPRGGGGAMPLQWGRRLSSTETRGVVAEHGHERIASMGPPTLVDGDLELGEAGPARQGASMGPPTLVDGDGACG